MDSQVVKVYIEDLPSTSNTPLFAYCRKLLNGGYPEETIVEFWRKGKDTWDCRTTNIRGAAEITVADSGGPGPRFVKYRPPVHLYAKKV